MSRFAKYIVTAVLLCAFSVGASAQFQKGAFTQNYATGSDTTGRDTSDVLFSFKNYFSGLKHKEEVKIGSLYAGSMIFIGGMQIYNKDYSKLPFIYGGLAATTGMGIYYKSKWNNSGDLKYKTAGNLFLAGAGLIYWGSFMDGIINYPTEEEHSPGKATLYSLILPGLGQAYNGEYWKIPIYYTCLMGAAHFVVNNNTNYQRYKRIHNEATSPDSEYTGLVTAESALYYRNVFRRFRDYSIVALAGFYLLQVIDANVFSYMRDFEITEDITMDVSPAVIAPNTFYASSGTSVGLRLGVTF